MADRLAPRDRCMRQLHDLVAEDHWLALFALRGACDRLDLDQLNSLVEDVADVEDGLGVTAMVLERLLRERFGKPE